MPDTPPLSAAELADSRWLVWWTIQADTERIVPLDTWPVYLYKEYQSRLGRYGRGRLWVSLDLEDAPEGITVEWDEVNNWLCKAARDAAGIVIKAEHLDQVQHLPGFVSTLAMTLPASDHLRRSAPPAEGLAAEPTVDRAAAPASPLTETLRKFLDHIDKITYRDSAGLRLSDATPYVAELRARLNGKE